MESRIPPFFCRILDREIPHLLRSADGGNLVSTVFWEGEPALGIFFFFLVPFLISTVEGVAPKV